MIIMYFLLYCIFHITVYYSSLIYNNITNSHDYSAACTAIILFLIHRIVQYTIKHVTYMPKDIAPCPNTPDAEIGNAGNVGSRIVIRRKRSASSAELTE